METSSTSTTLVQSWRIDTDSRTTTLAWLRIREVVQLDCAYLLPTNTFIGDECFQAGENDGETNSLDLVDLRFLFKLDLVEI